MRLARVCSGSREGPGLAERIARGRSPHVRVLELPGLACTPGLKGPRSRWVPALRPEQEWSRGFSLGLLHSRVLASRGQAPPVSCLGVQSAKDINRSMPHWKFSGELSKGSTSSHPVFLKCGDKSSGLRSVLVPPQLLGTDFSLNGCPRFFELISPSVVSQCLMQG